MDTIKTPFGDQDRQGRFASCFSDARGYPAFGGTTKRMMHTYRNEAWGIEFVVDHGLDGYDLLTDRVIPHAELPDR